MKSPILRDGAKSRAAALQLIERLLNQQVNPRHRRRGGDVGSAVEKMRERHHLSGTNRRSRAREFVAKVLRHGRGRRDEPTTGRIEETVERQARFSGRARSGDQQRIGSK